MLTNPYVLSLHNQEFLEMDPRKGPNRLEKRVATIEILDEGSTQAKA